MKLKRLYTNRSDLFVPIEFNSGLNVVVGKVTRPKDALKHSHNLGKSLLAKVIDFCLLKALSKNHFLKKHSKRFEGMVFFLEIELNSGGFLTIRRPVHPSTKISFWLNDESATDLSRIMADLWPESPTSLDASKEYLDSMLSFDSLGRYDYRKGISYFLRGQDDYKNVFQLSKFSGGKHVEWKPFMAMLLGYKEYVVNGKYQVDDKLVAERAFAQRLANESGTRIESFDKIRGLLTIKREELSALENQASQFDLRKEDSRINNDLVNNLERRNADINNRIYEIDYESKQIDNALGKRLEFDLDRIKIIFEQVSLFFPDRLLRSYDEAIQFHKEITEDRNVRLERRSKELGSERDRLQSELLVIDLQRKEALSVLREESWFARFKQLQSVIARTSAEISRLESQQDSVAQLEEVRGKIKSYDDDRVRLIDEIRAEVKQSNSTFEAIRRRFNEVFRSVFGVPALLSVQLNLEGNLEFEASPVESDLLNETTSEGEGNTYKKVLCAAFDLALLETYMHRSFYRFAYHDGIFESLDDRKKLLLLDTVRDSCSHRGVQYIMTIIDSDIPRNAAGRRVNFSDHEVVLTLHDDGDDGRLFKMPKF